MTAVVGGLTVDEVAVFAARARLLGHDPDRLLAGDVVETCTPIPTLEQVRALCLVSPLERRLRAAEFFHPAVAVRRRLGQGLHDRCEAFVFADGSAGEADRAGLAMHLPFAARQLSVLHRRVAAGEVWDLTVPHRSLGIDERDDLFNVVNVGELTIEPGGRVIVAGNLLVLSCQHLRGPDCLDPHGDPQLEVLPTPHSVDHRIGPLHGTAGAPGPDGGRGRPGRGPSGVPTLIGLALHEPPGEGMNGSDGGGGGRGGDGGPGRTGGATKTAEITISRLSGTLTLLAAGGRGGGGGAGGAGGDGGDGGPAAPAVRTTTGPLGPGRPGLGGCGGDGGDGGRGGNGGICSNVFLTVPEHLLGQLRVSRLPADGGIGGAAGEPGRGGTAGGVAGRPAVDIEPGVAGRPGRRGRGGLNRPAPAVFINGRPLQERTISP